MFTRSAHFYDKIYRKLPYGEQAEKIRAIVRERKRSPGNRLLDLACGTGGHLEHFRESFVCEGVDLDPNMVALARERHPGLTIHEADMAEFDLGERRFDVITCLFSSIGYVKTQEKLNATFQRIASHLEPGGVAIVEPWFQPHQWHTGRPHMTLVDEPELKICRMNTSGIEGDLSIVHFHYLVGTPKGTEHFEERHELTLFEENAYAAASASAGLEFTFDEKGLLDRGLVIATKPIE